MKICVWLDSANLEMESEIEIVQLIGSKFYRFSDRIARIDVSGRDLNGRKGGVDKLVRLTVHFKSGEAVTLSQRDSNWEKAVGKGAERLQATIARSLDRRNTVRNRTEGMARHLVPPMHNLLD